MPAGLVDAAAVARLALFASQDDLHAWQQIVQSSSAGSSRSASSEDSSHRLAAGTAVALLASPLRPADFALAAADIIVGPVAYRGSRLPQWVLV